LDRSSLLDSRLILALDFPQANVKDILEGLKGLVVGVKVGFPLALELGWEGIEQLISKFPDYYWMADFKLADIPDIVSHILKRFERIGFDSAIIHLFTGHRTYDVSLELIGVAGMSHPEAWLVRENFMKLLESASLLRIQGIVVGATRPEMIREARRKLPTIRIFSPGIGFQGARPGSALQAGANYEIVGRSILRSDDPIKAAEEIVRAQRGVLHGC